MTKLDYYKKTYFFSWIDIHTVANDKCNQDIKSVIIATNDNLCLKISVILVISITLISAHFFHFHVYIQNSKGSSHVIMQHLLII